MSWRVTGALLDALRCLWCASALAVHLIRGFTQQGSSLERFSPPRPLHAFLVCYRPLALTPNCFLANRPRLFILRREALQLARWLNNITTETRAAAALQPATAEARQDEEIERDEPEAYQRQRHGIALQDSFQVDALDVVLRLLGDLEFAVAVVVRRAQRDRWPEGTTARRQRPAVRHRCAAQRICAAKECESNHLQSHRDVFADELSLE